jgi:hypothetical protein
MTPSDMVLDKFNAILILSTHLLDERLEVLTTISRLEFSGV